MFIDRFVYITLFFLISYYLTIVFQNKDYLLTQKTNSILNKEQSIFFELIELIVLTFLSYMMHKEKKYVIMTIFIICLLEHIFQISFCYRQTINDLQVVTLLIFVLAILYSFYIKYYVIIPVFVCGLLIHIISLKATKSFTDKVCINSL